MNTLKTCLLLGLSVFYFAGCSNDEEPTPPSGTLIANLAGEWEATRAYFATVNANPSQEFEVIAAGGENILEISVNGRFTLVSIPVSQNAQIITGVFSISNNLLLAEFDDNPGVQEEWSLQNSGDLLFLQGPIKFDFQEDGIFEEAVCELDYLRK